jgi:hypothetical protein
MIDPREFEPLPFYPFDDRPASLPLTHDEASTAIFIARGDLKRAAELLKVQRPQLNRFVSRSYQLQRIQSEARAYDTRAKDGANRNADARTRRPAG